MAGFLEGREKGEEKGKQREGKGQGWEKQRNDDSFTKKIHLIPLSQ